MSIQTRVAVPGRKKTGWAFVQLSSPEEIDDRVKRQDGKNIFENDHLVVKKRQYRTWEHVIVLQQPKQAMLEKRPEYDSCERA